jgi:hypothetical protein
MPHFEKIEYKPIPVRELLLEMKNLSELMIDLAYSAHCLVTTPVAKRTSACLGDGSSKIPNRSTSYLGVSKATISMSQPLHAPELKWRTQGDFFLTHLSRS